MKKLAVALVILVAIIVGILLALPHIIDVNQYRGEIQAQLQQRLDRPVQLGQLSLGVFPLRVEANNVVIGEDPSFQGALPLAEVAQLDVSVNWLPLLSKKVEINSLELKRPKIELIRSAQGVWNFSTIGAAPAPANAPAQPQQSAAPASSQPGGGISLGELKITDGQIAVTDYQKNEPRQVYDHIDLALKNFAPGEKFSLDLTAHLPGSGTETFTLSGSGGPIDSADVSATPFKGRLKLDEVSLSGAQKFLNAQALAGTDAVISGSGDFSNENSVMSASGSLKFENAVVQGVKVGCPMTADFNVSDNSKTNVLDIKKCDLKLGSTPVSVQGTLTNGASPTINASIQTIDAKLGELLSIAKLFGVSAADGVTGSGTITLNVNASGPIKNTAAMNLSGSGSLQNVALQTPTLAQPLKIRSANLQFAQNSMNLTNLAASLGSTNATGNLSVANFQAPQLKFALNIDKLNVTQLEQITGGSQKPPAQRRADARWSLVPSVEAAAPPPPGFLQSATGNGTIAVGTITYEQTVLTNVHANVALDRGVIQLNPLASNIYGGQENGSVTVDTRPNPMTYAVNAKLTKVDANQLLSSVSSVKNTLYGTLGATTNISFATPPSGDVVQTLNGTMAINLANGKLMKLDLAGELSKIGKFGGVTPKGYTAISQMSGTFNVRNGVAQTNDMKAVLDIGNMTATGTINLVSQALNMHVTAVLNKSFSQSVGGTGVGGYLQTALANKNGELVLPVIITGNMNHPLVAPDLEQIAKMRVNNLGSLMGGILGGQQQSGKSASQPKQNNPLGGVLNGILGGKKP